MLSALLSLDLIFTALCIMLLVHMRREFNKYRKTIDTNIAQQNDKIDRLGGRMNKVENEVGK